MYVWMAVAALLLWPLVLVSIAAAVLSRRAARALKRWQLPIAVTELRVGHHAVIVVRTDWDITNPKAFEDLHRNLVVLFAAKGITVPILLFDRHLDFAVAGQGVADARQQVPA